MTKKTTTGLRLKEIMKEKSLRQVDILERSKPYQEEYGIKLAKNDLSQYVNDKVEPRQEKLFILAKTLDVSEAWLLGYDVPKGRITDDKQDILDIYNQLEPPRQDYVYSVAQDQLNEQNNLIHEDSAQYIITGRQTAAGSAIYVDDAEARINVLDASSSPVPRGADESVTVVGDSMEPLIKDGSQVYVRHQPQVENGEIALISIIDEGVTCKKFYADGDGFFTLKSINPDYDDMHFRGDQIRVIGKVLLKNS